MTYYDFMQEYDLPAVEPETELELEPEPELELEPGLHELD